ncbi:uncharacterized protein MONOS_6854 [Monocercomonoides exilis]|uniref:uncharacterized protein n=1 Tax=Monocercomonoides exilis TaxID=2049356 RepID=UPI00355A8FC0|nr:hypothetical protein MONOS_6854 [Monocercomonoides exilis]|eukprot:MONOS_6854.1-p1 / transcript=MONOS_6854.1 / gene=MONOS_6854 / organism=Monocercomonoides_exilis_PA203 / gene_product=unspecified product / transcript_product=unspecified product / location=Mono_scaffold00224:23094-23414(+) / protein_length=79 / sequence_SO=supercontig / SO=protein_coding / is_pseudo=false
MERYGKGMYFFPNAGRERGEAYEVEQEGECLWMTVWTRLSFSGQGMEAEVEEDGKKERQAQHFALGVWRQRCDKDGAR